MWSSSVHFGLVLVFSVVGSVSNILGFVLKDLAKLRCPTCYNPTLKALGSDIGHRGCVTLVARTIVADADDHVLGANTFIATRTLVLCVSCEVCIYLQSRHCDV